MNDEDSTQFHSLYSVSGTTFIGSPSFYGVLPTAPYIDLYDAGGDSDLTFPQGTTQPVTQQQKIQPPEKKSFEARLEELEKRIGMREDMVFKEITLRDIDNETAKEEILDYFKQNKGKRVYVSDILRELHIDPEITMKIMDELEEEGLIGEEEK